MTVRSEIARLARSKGINPPDWYLDLIDEFSDDRQTEEIYLSVEYLLDLNEDCRENGAWGCEWSETFWAIGGDGAGGIYFFDSANPQSPVYYIDHENSPKNINDTDHIGIQTPEMFRHDIIQAEMDFQRDCEEMRRKVANRKWWQVWIPRHVPKWSREIED